MAETLEIIITADDQVSRKLKGLSSSLGNLGKKMTSVGKGMTLGITAPLAAMGTMAVLAASDMEEAANKVDVVFGDAATSVHKFADDASTSLGMSSSAALEAAGTYGNLFTSMGIGQEAAAGMSTELLQLAADLASFNNIDPTVALEKLRAGLTGETEPLKTLGINLNQVAIKAKALELGLVESTVNMPKLEAATIKLSKAEAAAGDVVKQYGQDSAEAHEAINKVALAEQAVATIMEGKVGEMDAAAKAQAAYALILEQTTNAQGDFERTSEGLANTMRIIKASFGDVAAELGEVLLPIVSQFAGWLKTLLEKFQGLSPETRKMIVIFAAVAAAIGPLLIIVGSLISAISAMIPVIAIVAGALSGPILLVIGLLVAAIAALALAWRNNWGDIQGKTREVIGWLRDEIGTFVRWIQEIWAEYGEDIIRVVQGLWDGVVAVFTHFQEQIGRVYDAFQLAFEGDWQGFGDKLQEIWDEAWAFVVDAFSGFSETLTEKAHDLGVDIGVKIRETDWKQVGKDIITFIGDGIDSVTGGLKTKMYDLGYNLGQQIHYRGWIAVGKEMIIDIGKGIDEKAAPLKQKMYDLGYSLGQKIRETDWRELGKDIVRTLSGGILYLGTWIRTNLYNLGYSLGQKIRSVDWNQLGRDISIILGLGMISLGTWIKEKALHITRYIINGIRSVNWGQLGKDLVTRLGDGMLNLGNWIKDKTLQLLSGIVEKIRSVNWGQLGKDLVTRLGDGMITLGTWIKEKTLEITGGMVSKLHGVNWYQIGKDIVTAIGNGLTSLTSWLKSKAVQTAQAIYNVFKDFFNIQSPSKLMEEKIGMNIGAGLRLGIMKSLANLKTELKTELSASVQGVTVTQPAFSVAGARNGSGNRNVIINFSGPIYADPYELERMVLPIVEKGIRADRART